MSPVQVTYLQLFVEGEFVAVRYSSSATSNKDCAALASFYPHEKRLVGALLLNKHRLEKCLMRSSFKPNVRQRSLHYEVQTRTVLWCAVCTAVPHLPCITVSQEMDPARGQELH